MLYINTHEELVPKYDRRKSFYGKAVVYNVNGELWLKSYDTFVAFIGGEDKVYVNDTYSTTTLRHIKEFLKQFGYKAESKKQILEDYSVEF